MAEFRQIVNQLDEKTRTIETLNKEISSKPLNPATRQPLLQLEKKRSQMTQEWTQSFGHALEIASKSFPKDMPMPPANEPTPATKHPGPATKQTPTAMMHMHTQKSFATFLSELKISHKKLIEDAKLGADSAFLREILSRLHNLAAIAQHPGEMRLQSHGPLLSPVAETTGQDGKGGGSGGQPHQQPHDNKENDQENPVQA